MRSIFLAAGLCALTATAALAQAAPRADANGDGKVTLSEFRTGRVTMMLRADADRDGQLSKAELEAAAAARQARGGRAGLIFGVMDADKDGFLSRTEIDRMVERRFRRIDVNGDGSLSAGEMQALRGGATGGAGGGA